MAVISLDPQEARQTASRFVSGVQSFGQDLNMMHGSSQQVLGSWQGPSKYQFEERWEHWNQQFRALIEDLERLSQGLRLEADQFEAADHAFGS